MLTDGEQEGPITLAKSGLLVLIRFLELSHNSRIHIIGVLLKHIELVARLVWVVTLIGATGVGQPERAVGRVDCGLALVGESGHDALREVAAQGEERDLQGEKQGVCARNRRSSADFFEHNLLGLLLLAKWVTIKFWYLLSLCLATNNHVFTP